MTNVGDIFVIFYESEYVKRCAIGFAKLFQKENTLHKIKHNCKRVCENLLEIKPDEYNAVRVGRTLSLKNVAYQNIEFEKYDHRQKYVCPDYVWLLDLDHINEIDYDNSFIDGMCSTIAIYVDQTTKESVWIVIPPQEQCNDDEQEQEQDGRYVSFLRGYYSDNDFDQSLTPMQCGEEDGSYFFNNIKQFKRIYGAPFEYISKGRDTRIYFSSKTF